MRYSTAANHPSQTRELPVLGAANLSKSFGVTRALNHVNLSINPGESVAIMGPSGSGKSTLMHVLAGILVPDAGTVTFVDPAGRVPATVSDMSEKQRSALRRHSFGFVFQQGLLLDELTAVENVALALMLNGVARKRAEADGARWLAALGLDGLAGRLIGELSGGQAQRVAIARAQVTGAPVIFADEPTGALDTQTSTEVMDVLLDSTVGTGKTLVVVTHDHTVAQRCSRIVSLQDGVITADSGTGTATDSPEEPAMDGQVRR